MHVRSFIFALLLLVIVPPSQAQNCGRLEPALVVSQKGRVTPGPANNMRSRPTTSSNNIGSIPGGEVFEVLEGPNCTNGYAWWRVNYNGTVGWTAEYDLDTTEYWLEPIIDGVLVQHLQPLGRYDQLRDISAGYGGGMPLSCWFPVGFDPGRAGFWNNTLTGRPGSFWDISGMVGLSRDRVTRAVGIGPQGQQIHMSIFEMYWLDRENCVGLPSGGTVTNEPPVDVAILPPTAYFYPGTWEIQLTTNRGVQSGRVRIADGDDVLVWTDDDITYAYNLRPNEELRFLAFAADPVRGGARFERAYSGRADRDGRIAFYNASYEILVGRSGSVFTIGILTTAFSVGDRHYDPSKPNDVAALGSYLRRIFWP